jgi:ribosomal protein S12 methylthiotransferase accessory factor
MEAAPLRLRDLLAAAETEPLLSGSTTDRLDQLLGRLLPLCRRCGITRLGDLTGLDRIGLPVVQAVRPGALSEVTSLGRGLSKAEAAVGAIMESLERFFAESIAADRVFVAAADDLGIEENLFDELAAPARRRGWRQMPLPWIMALDVSTGALKPVPLEVVHTCYSDPPPSGDGAFLRSTTGLACHTHAHKAFLHGLFECIERDAIARAFVTHGFFERHRLEPSLPFGPRVERLLDIASDSGLSVALWHAPSPTKVPVIWCQTIEAGRAEPILALPTEGYGAGATLEGAVANALLEALVTRAGAISGTRDDLTLEHYRSGSSATVVRARNLILDVPAAASTAPIETSDATSLDTLVERVVAAGLGPVLAVPVGSDGETGVECVRTVLPRARPFSVVR